jgi:DNA polymerase-3 subunit gamma/tau
VLTKAEFDIRGSMQPRYHLEMALLRWIHLRKLVPLTDLIKQLEGGPRSAGSAPAAKSASVMSVPSAAKNPSVTSVPSVAKDPSVPSVAKKSSAGSAPSVAPLSPVDPSSLKERFLEEVRKAKKFFFGTVVAQAQKIEFEGERLVFTFSPQHRALRAQLEQNRPYLEQTASQLAGRKMTVSAAEGPTSPSAAPAGPRSGFVETSTAADAASVGSGDKKQELKDRALADSGVQTMLDVFAAEIKDVEEM